MKTPHIMNLLTTQIRRALPQDARQIAETHDEAWRYAYSGIVPYSALTKMIERRREDWWETAIKRSTVVLVLEIGDTIAGYATLGRNRVSTLPHQGEIYEIYLRPEYQGIGLGKRLFLTARRELKARGLEGTVVWALADNQPACQFYLNAGGNEIAKGKEQFDGKSLLKLAYAWD